MDKTHIAFLIFYVGDEFVVIILFVQTLGFDIFFIVEF